MPILSLRLFLCVDSDLTPMGRSFYSESRFMTNSLIKTELKVKLRLQAQYSVLMHVRVCGSGCKSV